MSLFKRLFGVAMLLSFLAVIPACNTVEGVGKDTQKAGEKLENAADRNK
jgi:predicted small secreted protein